MDNNQKFWKPEKVLYILVSFLILVFSIWLMLPIWNKMKGFEDKKKPAKIIDLKLPNVKKRSVTFRE